MTTANTTTTRRAKAPGDFSPEELSTLRRIMDLRARLLTRVEVAALAGFESVESIKRAERDGLRSLKLNPRVVRYEPADVLSYLAAARVA